MDGFEPSDIMAVDVDLCIQYMTAKIIMPRNGL